jgi:C1A family cysteine protease
MLGYQNDDSVPGGGYFIVRNSWGTRFGKDSVLQPGHARLPYDYMKLYGKSAYTASVGQLPQEDDSLCAWLRRLWRRLFGS